MRYNSPANDRLYISLNAGDQFYFGMSLGVTSSGTLQKLTDNVFVRIKDELGNIVFGPIEIKNLGDGHLESLAETLIGPKQLNGTTGYDALLFTATAKGNYYLEVNYQNPTTYMGGVPFNATFFCIDLFDFTVVDNGGKIQPGRVWSRAWQIRALHGTLNINTSTKLDCTQYIYTDDGIVSKLKYNGLQPFHYIIVSNDHGVTNTGNFLSDRRSRAGDEKLLSPQYRLFFDVPDTTVFPLSDLTGIFGQLNSPITITGCPYDYCINIDVDKDAFAIVLLDINGIEGYQGGTQDVLLNVELKAGDNCVKWDGIDGLGNLVTEGIIRTEIKFAAGITHLPMYDVEFNEEGINVEFVYPTSIAGPTTIYWDDVNIPNGEDNSLTGCTFNCHTWTNLSYGDQGIINSWWYITQKPTVSLINMTLVSVEIGPDKRICEGEKLTLEAPEGWEAYEWTPTGLFDTPTEQLVSANFSTTTTVTLTVKDTAGCDHVDALTVQVDKRPIALIKPIDPICIGSGVVLEASGGIGYDWIGITTGLSATSIANPVATPLEGITYTVALIDINGCKDTTTIDVVVNKRPEAFIKPVDPICVGDEISLEASGGLTYRWIGVTSGLNSTKIWNPLASPAYTVTYQVEVTDINDCKDSALVKLIVHPLPQVIASDSVVICRGESTELTVSGEANAHTWSPSVSLSTTTGAAVIASPVLTTLYYVEGEDANNCKATDSVWVTVHHHLIPEVAITGHDTCIGKEVTFTVTSSLYLGNAPSYNWGIVSGSTGDTTFIGASPFASFSTENLLNGDGVVVIVASNQRCLHPTKKVAISNMAVPAIYDYPALETTGDILVCFGDSVAVRVVDNKGLATTFDWLSIPTDSLIWTPDDFHFFNGYSQGTYHVRATNWHCTSYSDSFRVRVIKPYINAAVMPDVIKYGESTTVSATTNSTITDWTHSLSTGVISTTSSFSHSPDFSSYYTVNAELEGCTTSDTVWIKVLYPYQAPYFFSPNGDNNNDNWVILELENYDTYTVTIYNRWGNIVREYVNHMNGWDGTNREGTQVPEGVYYYVIQTAIRNEPIELSGHVTVVR